MKIIIIGAGIGGLTLALACQKAGFNATIYEKATTLRNIGGGVLLWPNGLRYLEWLGLGDYLKPYRVAVKRCNIVGIEGHSIFREEYADFYRLLDGEILPIERSLLQQTLASKLDNNTLHLNKQCVAIHETASQVEVVFADGTRTNADLVIGADGIRSMARTHMHNCELDYTNYCWWGGIIAEEDVPEMPADEVFVAIGLGKTCIMWPTINNRFMWYLPVKMPTHKLSSGDAGLAQIKDICADWNPIVTQIINATSGIQRFQVPIYCLPPQSQWSTERVTLLGDAAHAIGPILGLGTNLAIEDVFVLINCLKQNSLSLADRLKRYETLRYSRCHRFHELETLAAATMVNDDLETLKIFQQQLPQLNIVAFYQDLVPLINQQACQDLAHDAINMAASATIDLAS